MEKYKTIIEVEWWDAETILDDWTDIDEVDKELQDENYKSHKAVGYFLKETDDYIALVQNISNDQVQLAIRIPKISIKSINLLNAIYEDNEKGF